MKILLMMVLFNVHTGTISNSTALRAYDTADSCLAAIIQTGAQHPDAEGNVKLYTCAVPRTEL